MNAATMVIPDVRAGEASRPAAPDFVVIDVETACARVSSICQIGIVGFREGREVFEYETLVDPCDDFSPFNTRIHGITADHVVGQPTFAHVHSQIDAMLSGRTTVAHSFFDKGALASACCVHERTMIEPIWLDSVRVAKRAWPELPSHRLNALTRFLGVRHKHHDALSDARAAGMVIVRAIEHTGIGLQGWLTPANPGGGRRRSRLPSDRSKASGSPSLARAATGRSRASWRKPARVSSPRWVRPPPARDQQRTAVRPVRDCDQPTAAPRTFAGRGGRSRSSRKMS